MAKRLPISATAELLFDIATFALLYNRFACVTAALVICGLLLQTTKRGISVDLSVGLSVCLSVRHDRELCKTSEPIAMTFGMLTRVGTMYYEDCCVVYACVVRK